LNNSATLNEIISSELFAMFDLTSVKQDINNYLGKGQIYNLPESQIIFGNNITIEFSSVDLELEKLIKLAKGEDLKSKASIMDLSQCQNILKKKYGLKNEESLVLLKGDFLDKIPEKYITNKVAYQLFSTSLGAFLPLIDCKEQGASTNIMSFFNSSYLLGNFQYKAASATEDNYNVFDPKSSFYNDICTPFTNENGNDVLLDERRLDYFTTDYNLCEEGCEFLGYNETIKRYTCKCEIKSTTSDKSTNEQKPMEIPEDFYKKQGGYSNIKIFKCASQVFSAKGQKANFGSYILMLCLAGFIGIIVFYFLKGQKMQFSILDNLIKKKKKEEPKQMDKEMEKERRKYEELNMGQQVTDINEDRFLKEDELNFGNYNQIEGKDPRTPLKMFWSFLKFKQIILYSFYTTDKNLRILKISVFILFVSFYMAFTALFFNDEIMRAIYIYKGNTDAAVHIPNIILSSICSIIMSFIVRLLTYNERTINEIITEKENKFDKIELAKRSSRIKTIVFFSVSSFIIMVCWYYVSAFCAVFKNSQGHYLINTLVSFIICMLWPLVTSWITVGLRKLSLNKKSPTLYKVSQIVSLF